MTEGQIEKPDSLNCQGGGSKPNVVLITLDACRYDTLVENLSSLPNLKALAEKSAFFENAFSVGPTTFFAFAGMIGGTYPYHWGTGLHRPVRAVDEVLKNAGYRTGVLIELNPFLGRRFGYGSNADVQLGRDGLVENADLDMFPPAPAGQGRNGREARAWRHFDSPYALMGLVRKLRPLWERNRVARMAGGCVLHAFRFVSEYGRGKGPRIDRARLDHGRFREHLAAFIKERFQAPQFLWIHTMVSHLPYVTPANGSEFSTRRTDYLNARGITDFVNQGTCRQLKKLYVESLRSADSMVGEILDALSSRGLLDSSIVIVTSDHGEEFMEEGRFSHGFESSDILLHVPLMISWGEIIQPRRVQGPVSTMDIPSTICELLGIEVPESFGGMSLKQVLCETTVDEAVSRRLWGRPLFSEAWMLRSNLDRRPGYMSQRRVFTVRKNRYKLKVTEVERGGDTIEETLELTDWTSGSRLDVKSHGDVVEELRYLLREHLFEEGVAARNLRRRAEQDHVRSALDKVKRISRGSAGRRL